MTNASTLPAAPSFIVDADDREYARTHFHNAAQRARYWLGERKGRGPRPDMAERCYREMVTMLAMYHGIV